MQPKTPTLEMAIRVLTVDDEPLARKRIRRLLEGEPDVELVGECGNGAEAISAIRTSAPDLVFLDVQMPELDGFGVLRRLDLSEGLPYVIFVTAYDEYALQAFEVHALDYVLKPFDRKRFRSALERARREIERDRAGNLNRRLLDLLDDLSDGPKHLDRVLVKSGGRVFFVKADEIDWIEAAGNYVRLHAAGESHLVRDKMKGLEAKLDPKRFARIHRSSLVNLDRIKELEPWFHGDYKVLLKDGTRLTLSRTYREKLRSIWGDAL